MPQWKTHSRPLLPITVIGVASAVGAVASLVAAYRLNETPPRLFFAGLLANLGTTFAGVAATILVLDRLSRRAQQYEHRRQLLRDIGGASNGTALRAIQELKAAGALSDGSLAGQDFSQARLEGVRLTRADLHNTRLRDANLESAVLFAVDLRGTDLRGANLKKAALIGCDLRDADLFGAHLEGSELRKVDMRNSLLVGAFLSGAVVKGCNMDGARFGMSTLWPDAFDPKEHGALDKGDWFGSFFDTIADEIETVTEGDPELKRLLEDD